MKHAIIALVCLAQVLLMVQQVDAQIPATINIQGVLRNANGTAIPDGSHTVIFKFYEEAEVGAGTAKWTETQDVEVTSGIYTAILGSVAPFNEAVPPIIFDRQYFLEVVVSGKALVPRVPLTPAPYALALLGDPNTFPSSGAVRADGAVIGEDLDTALINLSPEHSVVIKGGALARTGTPGADGASNNGYAFTGDKDSGLFSTGNNKAAIYTNNAERLLVSNDSVKVQGTAQVNGNINTTGYVDLTNTKSIRYNGQNDWRLVETDYLENNAENWQYSPPTAGNQGAWSNSTLIGASVTTFSDPFAGKAMVAGYGQVFKKQFTLPQTTPYTYVKVVFNYYFIDSWDLTAQEMGWAAFSTTSNASNGLSVGWVYNTARIGFASGLNGLGFDAAADFTGNSAFSDQWVTGEMIARYPSTGSANFWVMIGGTLDSAPGDEQFGVGKIEIWVK